MSKYTVYLYNHRAPPSSMSTDTKQLVENEGNVPWLFGLGHDTQLCPGLCFQQIPKSVR